MIRSAAMGASVGKATMIPEPRASRIVPAADSRGGTILEISVGSSAAMIGAS